MSLVQLEDYKILRSMGLVELESKAIEIDEIMNLLETMTNTKGNSFILLISKRHFRQT